MYKDTKCFRYCGNYLYIVLKISVRQVWRKGRNFAAEKIERINMQDIQVQAQRGVLLDGTLFECANARMRKCGSVTAPTTNELTHSHVDTLLIAITGIHGNFYSSPCYSTPGHKCVFNTNRR